MNNLVWQLAEFLTYILQDLWTIPGFRHATEQAKSSADNDCIESVDDCIDIVFEKIAAWASRFDDKALRFYGEEELLTHKQMWDLLRRDKKELRFTDRCRRVVAHSEKTALLQSMLQRTSGCLLPSDHW